MKKLNLLYQWTGSTFSVLITSVLLSTTAYAQRPPGYWKQVYENEVITESTLIINQDSVLFYNCTFRDISGEKYALELRNCTNSVIKDCKFYDIATQKDGNVIALRDNRDVVVDNCEIYDHRSEGHSGGIKMWGPLSENITIRNNNIHDIAGNGIISGGCSSCNSKPNPAPHDVPNLGLEVLNNRIVNVGLSPDLVGNSPKHGMYIKAMDPLIEGNYIEATHDGAGISIRSTGIVRNNFIMNTKISGIICSNMKPAGPSGKIIVENNVIVQKWRDTPTWASPLSAYFTEDPYPVRYDTAIVRFNTVVGYPDVNPNLRLVRVDDYGLRTNDQAYGNLIVDLRETPKFWRNEKEIEYRSNNYTRTNLNDFVNPTNLDFRLKEKSGLIDVITSEPRALPSSDQNENALVFPLEPGAHQYVSPCQPENLALAASIHSTSGEQTGNGAANLIDGDLSNRWSSKDFPQWVIVDLGERQNINEIQLVPYLDRAYQYQVYAGISLADLQSNDPSALVLDKSGNTEPGEQKNKFNSCSARYVKLLVTGASGYSGEWVSFHELRIVQPCESANPAFAEYWMEAECGTLGALWDSKTDPQASRDEYIEVRAGNNSYGAAPSGSESYVSFPVNMAENGQYRLWGRVLSPSSADDSFWLRVDKGVWSLWSVGTNNAWAWRQKDSYSFTAGDHTIDLAYREDGAKIDKLYLTTGSNAPESIGVDTDFGCDAPTARTATAEARVMSAQPDLEAAINVYPNPASRTLTVEYASSYNITMYDLTGRVVLQQQRPKGSSRLNVESVRPGAYLIKLVDAQHRELHRRVIIQ